MSFQHTTLDGAKRSVFLVFFFFNVKILNAGKIKFHFKIQ